MENFEDPYAELVGAIEIACLERSASVVYSLTRSLGMTKSPGRHDQEYNFYRLALPEGGEITLSHRWHDPSKTFEAKPDIESFELVNTQSKLSFSRGFEED